MSSVDKYFQRFPITTPTYNVTRIAGKQIRDRASRYFSGRMIEIGCGTKAKGLLVGEFVTEHIGLDHEDCPHDQSNIDLFGTAYDIPVDDDSFDCVLSTAVMEHLEEPLLALIEAHRVLRPGGYALYTMPLFWHLHEEPRDFFRYTRYGLHYMFEKAGFSVLEITPLSGFWITFGTEFNYYLRRFAKGPLRPLVNSFTALTNLIYPFLDQGKLRDERFTWMYIVVAQKPKHFYGNSPSS
ncbi:MAG: class I SAM-dependent methyltransferase [Ardenticatenaceae bacterium]|nr:class I SAM-dependent methyltransferase [Ardenticatenaceae bacterium]